VHSHLLNIYRRLPVTFTHGHGIWLYDSEGNCYLDALSGIAVNGLGHSNPSIVAAIQDQASKLLHTSNLYHNEYGEKLAKLLCELTGLHKAFFCNSGAESNEAAIKLARLYGHSKGIDAPQILVMENAYHGRTLTTLSASGNSRIQNGFGPLVPNFIKAPFNDLAAIEIICEKNPNISAIFLEPIQGEAGIMVAEPGFLKGIRAICDKYKILMMLDEIQTGIGRTGSLFMYQQEHIIPDVLTFAKGLANGIPIGACLFAKPYCDLFTPGSHGSTFGGNPLATRIALVTINEIIQNKWFENARIQGDKIISGLKLALQDNPHVVDIRGQGLMIGIELDTPCRDILEQALDKRILFNITREKVIRLLPPLIISDAHSIQIIETVASLINNFFDKGN